MADEAPLDVAGRVVAAAAHDVNNHLAAISLQAELALASAPPDEKLRRRLEGILGSCENARELTRSLLAFGGRRVLRPAPVDVAEAVRRVDAEAAVDDAPLVAEVDPAVLDEALAQLVAIGGEDGAPVTARADGDVVEIRFACRGVEPDEETRRRLFEPYTAEGDPLALGGVYGFVRQSGGTIALERAGGEAAIVLRLPRR